MNMRTHHLSCLAMAEPKDGKKKEHDMAAIKRSTAEALRNGAKIGRKVMLIWDKACIDYRHWFKLKVSGVPSALHRDLLRRIHRCHSFRIYDTYELRLPCAPAFRCVP